MWNLLMNVNSLADSMPFKEAIFQKQSIVMSEN